MIACLALPDLDGCGNGTAFPPETYGLDFDESMTLYARGDMHGNVIVRRMLRRLSDARVVHDDGEAASIRGEGKPVQLSLAPKRVSWPFPRKGSCACLNLLPTRSFP